MSFEVKANTLDSSPHSPTRFDNIFLQIKEKCEQLNKLANRIRYPNPCHLDPTSVEFNFFEICLKGPKNKTEYVFQKLVNLLTVLKRIEAKYLRWFNDSANQRLQKSLKENEPVLNLTELGKIDKSIRDILADLAAEYEAGRTLMSLRNGET